MEDRQPLVIRTRMNPGAIQRAEIEVSRASSPENKTDLPLIAHAIKEAKAMNRFRRDVALPFSTFSDGGFVQLPVIAPHAFDEIVGPIWCCRRVATDAACINHMRLL